MVKSVSERVKVRDSLKTRVARLMPIHLDERIKVRTLNRMVVRDAETMEVLRDQVLQNVICTASLTKIALRLATPWGAAGNYAFLCLGDDVAPSFNASDTDLDTPVEASWGVTTRTPAAAIATYYKRYLPEDANGHTYTEAGIFEALGAGTAFADRGDGVLMNHIAVSPDLEKTDAILVDFYLTFTFS